MPRTIQRGDLWYVTNEMTQGHEEHAGRPGVIVSLNNDGGTCMVVYLTCSETRAAENPAMHVRIDSAPRPSVALCDQVKTLDVRRLDKYIGRITKEEREAVDCGLICALGLYDTPSTLPEIMQPEPQQESPEEYGPAEDLDDLEALRAELDQEHEACTTARAEAKTWKEVAERALGWSV